MESGNQTTFHRWIFCPQTTKVHFEILEDSQSYIMFSEKLFKSAKNQVMQKSTPQQKRSGYGENHVSAVKGQTPETRFS